MAIPIKKPTKLRKVQTCAHNPARLLKKEKKPCISCEGMFYSEGKYNVICKICKKDSRDTGMAQYF